MIAGFIILRLRNILGRKTGHEDKYYTNFSDQKFKDFQQEEDKSKVNDILSDKLEGDQKREFLKGAEIAYETILTAFAKGDNKSLKDLLTQDMNCLLYTSPSPRDGLLSRMPSSA